MKAKDLGPLLSHLTPRAFRELRLEARNALLEVADEAWKESRGRVVLDDLETGVMAMLAVEAGELTSFLERNPLVDTSTPIHFAIALGIHEGKLDTRPSEVIQRLFQQFGARRQDVYEDLNSTEAIIRRGRARTNWQQGYWAWTTLRAFAYGVRPGVRLTTPRAPALDLLDELVARAEQLKAAPDVHWHDEYRRLRGLCLALAAYEAEQAHRAMWAWEKKFTKADVALHAEFGLEPGALAEVMAGDNFKAFTKLGADRFGAFGKAQRAYFDRLYQEPAASLPDAEPLALTILRIRSQWGRGLDTRTPEAWASPAARSSDS